MNLSLFTIVCLKLQGSEPLCRHTPAISSQCKRQGIFILVFVAESSKRGRHTAGHCRTSHALYPPQSCPIGGWIHVTITAPPPPPGQGYWDRRRLTLPMIEIPWCFILPVL